MCGFLKVLTDQAFAQMMDTLASGMRTLSQGLLQAMDNLVAF